MPLIGKIKDAQFAFATFPDKKIKMTVLVADVPDSYGMLLGHNFCKDVGGELNMDMTEAKIPIKGIVQKLVPEKETKYTLVKFDDPHAQIFFESIGFGNYYLHVDEFIEFSEDWPSSDSNSPFLSANEGSIQLDENQVSKVNSFDSQLELK